jgi:hypothetical protein
MLQHEYMLSYSVWDELERLHTRATAKCDDWLLS